MSIYSWYDTDLTLCFSRYMTLLISGLELIRTVCTVAGMEEDPSVVRSKQDTDLWAEISSPFEGEL